MVAKSLTLLIRHVGSGVSSEDCWIHVAGSGRNAEQCNSATLPVRIKSGEL